jgi:hypothetical protein
MSPILFWMLGISLSSTMMITVVALDLRLMQFALSFVIVGFIALAGVRDQRTLQEMGAFPSHVSATMIRHIGIIYGWAAAIIALIYMTLLDWQHWFAAFFVMCAGATLCLFLANIIMRDLTENTVDRRLANLVATIAKVQLAVICLVVGGLLALGASLVGGESSAAAAAVSVLLAAAIGIAALSAYMIFFPNGFDFTNDDADQIAVVTPEKPKKTPQAAAAGRPVRAFGRAKPAV